MNHNSTARVIRSHHSLVLQKLTRQSAGRYSCVAANSEGETYSNELTFRVKCKCGILFFKLIFKKTKNEANNKN